jgi:uncharacterized membrane protein (Fun14 family)
MNVFRTQITRQLTINKRVILKSMAFSTMMTTISSGTMTLCEGRNNNENDKNILEQIKNMANDIDSINIDTIGQILGSQAQEAINSGIPTQISYGFLCGYSSGYALKKVGKVASGVFGLGFMTLQSLAYAGYIQVNHSALKEDVEKVFDFNKDGVVDDKDGKLAYDQIMEVLQFNMMGGSGFAAGFMGGFKSG